MSSLRSIIGRCVVTSMYYIFRVFPVKKNKIYVKNFYGRGFGDSPKYIIECLLKQTCDFDIVWCVKGKQDFPEGIRTVEIDSVLGLIRSIYEQVTAKIWIDNAWKYRFERKRKSQYYIQTWHGDIGVKKILGDIVEKSHKVMIDNAKNDSKMIDLFVCGNRWFQERCDKRFFYEGETALCGLPRRDIFYTVDNALRGTVKTQLGIPGEVKVLLYVPTYRKEESANHRLGQYVSCFDWQLILESLRERFGGEWYGLMRLHPNAAKYGKELVLPSHVINVTEYPDISELMCISDVCISDYSSALFDFSITGKAGFIFAPDKDKYEDVRGYLFPDDVIPFSVAEDISELAKNIKMFEANTFSVKHKLFYNDTIHVQEDGHASEYLVKKILDICNL